MPPNALVRARIESLAFGGESVARGDDGKVIFCRFAAPGELVDIRITEDHKRWARGLVETIVETSDARVEPVCQHFGKCGACQWQHVSYDRQLEAKLAIVQNAMRKFGVAVEGIEPASAPYGTRRRVRLIAHRGELAYRSWRSHELVAITECPVLEPRLWQALCEARQALDGEVQAIVGDSIQIVSHAGARGSPPNLAAKNEPALIVPANAFAQASSSGDHALAACVRDFAAASGQRVLELFAGAGNFTRWLLLDGGVTLAVEGDAQSFAFLERNAGGAQLVRDDVGRVIRRLAEKGREFDVVVLDPPREGCQELLDDLLRLKAQRIVYLSCDPMTLGRDLQRLVDAGYAVKRVRAFDLVPQTSHVETAVLCEHASKP